MVVVVAAVMGEFEKDAVVADDNLQNTNHVVAGIPTSSCWKLWLKSDFLAAMCLPSLNGMRPGL